MRTLLFFPLLVALMLVLSSTAYSASTNVAEIPDRVEKIRDRIGVLDLNVTQEMRKVTIESKRYDDFGELFLNFRIKAEETFSIKISAGLSEMDGSLGHELNLDFIGILEFEDVNSNNMFDKNTDIIYTIYPLSNKIYFTDVIKDIKIIDNESFFNVTREQFNEELVSKYYEGYDNGLEEGYALGFQEGEKDVMSNYTYNDFYYYHLSTKQIVMLFENAKEEQQFDEEAEYSSYSYKEMIDLFRTGFYNGLSKGFKNGYSQGFKDQATGSSSSGTRNFWSTYDYLGLNIFERPEYWLPRYKPVEVVDRDPNVELKDINIKIEGVGGMFSVDAIISNHFSKIDNGYLSPSSIKLNINMEDYPFKQKDTKLVLISNLEVRSRSTGNISISKLINSLEESVGIASNEKELRISTDNFTGYFSWNDYAECNGVPEDVFLNEYSYYSSSVDFTTKNTSFKQVHTTFNLLMTYPGCDKISHDPKLGISKINKYDLYSLEARDLPDLEIEEIDLNNLAFILTTIVTISFIIVTKYIKGRQ